MGPQVGQSLPSSWLFLALIFWDVCTPTIHARVTTSTVVKSDSFGDAAAEVFEEVRDHSPLAKKIDDAFQKALREIGGTMAKFEGTFVNQRNRVLGMET